MSFSANRSKLCLTISSTVSLKVDGVSIFCFISVKELTFGDDPVLGARLSLTFTKSHSLTGSDHSNFATFFKCNMFISTVDNQYKKLTLLCCLNNGVNS